MIVNENTTMVVLSSAYNLKLNLDIVPVLQYSDLYCGIGSESHVTNTIRAAYIHDARSTRKEPELI